MSLFTGSKAYLDFSYELRDRRTWKDAIIRDVEYLSGGMSVIALDATNGLVAVGTKDGKIFVFSSPPAAILLRVSRAVKFLSFAALVFKLICVDDHGMLYVWDLSQLGRPKLVMSERYKEPITCLTTSPYHSHAFIGLERGVIVTFDILCLSRSPYTIPNLWKSHERQSTHSGMQLPQASNSLSIMDIIVHPRDLNLLFVCYSGGVVLYDLTERRPLHHYGLVIPPGAPGAIGYHDPDVLKTRRPVVTSVAVHASGQIFVAGHIDGTLAFWAVDDEDGPVMVRTIQEVHINYPDGEKLDTALSNPRVLPGEDSTPERLEPIFKLSWSSFGVQSLSDPYNGDTALTILGGIHQQAGVTVLHFPPLALPPVSSPSSLRIEPDTRNSLEKAFSSNSTFWYDTLGPAADFHLVPKEGPHFGGNLDPGAILIIFEWPEGQRSMHAMEFPPPIFDIKRTRETPVSGPSSESNASNPLDAELSSTLKTMSFDNSPKDYSQSLPSALWTGICGICDGDIVRLENEEYESLQRGYQQSMTDLFARLGRDKVSGIAWVDYAGYDQNQDVLFTKRQPHRLLITHHRDLTVRFQDISPQLLIGSASSPLPSSFPAPLPHSIISLPCLLADSCIINARRPLILNEADIQSAQLTSETNECVIVMRSGHVFVFRFDSRQRYMSTFVDTKDDLIRLVHIPAAANTFQPLVMIENAWGPVTTAEVSDVGFLAVAYGSGALIVVDIHRPKIIFRDEVDAKSQKRISKALHIHDADSEKCITSMKWVVCGYGEDSTPKLRLLACHRSGNVRAFTLSRDASQEWTVADVQKLEGMDRPLPHGTFVLQAKTGSSRTASRATFREALRGAPDPALARTRDLNDEGAHCFWVSTGEKGAKCQVNLVGRKASRVDWGRGRKIECVQVVSRDGSHVLVAAMQDREVIVYSLPALEPMHMFQIPKHPNSVICFDDTGDFVDWTFDERGETVVQATMGTLFAIRRVFDEPVIDFTSGRRSAPSMPPPVPLAPISYLGSWFNFKKGKSGDAIDDLLAGPDRPIPQDAETSTIVNNEWQAQMQSRARAFANQASQTSSNLYANLSAAVSERGEVLSGLQEQFGSLEAGGKKMMLEAKKLAVGQTGKRWFNF